MVISTPNNLTSQSTLYLKSNKTINLRSGLGDLPSFNYNNTGPSSIVIETPTAITNGSTIKMNTYMLDLNAFQTNITNSLYVAGSITTPNNSTVNNSSVLNDLNFYGNSYIAKNLTLGGSIKSVNLGQKSPIYFTTNRNININGTTFSCYDIDLNKYTKSILLDGYNTRQFRIRTWLSDGDVQNIAVRIVRADIFMTDRGGLNIYALCAPYPNENLNSTDSYLDQFLYRDTFNRMIYCSRFGSKKVYCIFEDLL